MVHERNKHLGWEDTYIYMYVRIRGAIQANRERSPRIELDEAIMSSETAKLMRKVRRKRNRFIIIFYSASVTIITNVFAPDYYLSAPDSSCFFFFFFLSNLIQFA